MIRKHILLITFLNEQEIIFLYTVKEFEALLFNTYNSIQFLLVGCLGFIAYQSFRSFNAKSIFMQIVSSISNNSV